MSLTLLCVLALAGQSPAIPVEDPSAATAPVVDVAPVVDDMPAEPAAAAAAPADDAPAVVAPAEPAPAAVVPVPVPVDAVPIVDESAPIVVPTTAPEPTPTFVRPPTTNSDPFAPGTVGNHLLWYGPEYVAVATVGVLYLAGVHKLVPPGPALIGPRFDVARPDLDVLFDPRLDDTIGRPFLREQVSNGALTIGTISVIAATSLLDLATAGGDLQHTHAVLLGGAETLAGTVLLVEALKPLFGRLRPDFRDRYVHAACGGTIDVPDGLDCSGVDASFTIDADDLRDGQKSFASGHAATSFAMATFASWWLGSSLVWAEDAPAWGPAVGALGIGGMMTAAGWVSSTRLNDNRHHVEDVVVGAGLGATVATTLFLTHFDWRGKVRHRSFSVSPALGMGSTGTGTGLAVVGDLP